MGEVLPQKHGKAVRFLSSGTGGAPNGQLSCLPALGDKIGNTDFLRASKGLKSRKNEVSLVVMASTTWRWRPLKNSGL